MTIKAIDCRYWSGGSGPMVWMHRHLCHCYLLYLKIKEFVQRNLQSFGNLIDHAGGHIMFSTFDTTDLFTGISHKESQIFLRHISGQSQFAHAPPQSNQKIFVYHILHIQEWWFIKNSKSPYMGYFLLFLIKEVMCRKDRVPLHLFNDYHSTF